MLPVWKFWLVLSLPLVTQVIDALPTNFDNVLHVPLAKVDLKGSFDEHPIILHQQLVNRGLKRYARMTGRPEPSITELQQNIILRLNAMPPAELEKRFYGLDAILENLRLNGYNISTLFPGKAPNFLGPPNNNKVASQASSPDTQVSIPLTIEAQDFGYMGNFSLGTPPRTFQLLVDSGSADLWVGGEGCHADDGGSCGNHTFLGPESSNTYNDSNKSWSIQYGTGKVSGHIVQDTVDVAGLRLSSMKFGVAFNESSEFTPDFIPFDGLMGLCRSEILSVQGVPTLVEALYSTGLISQPITSYKIPRFVDHRNDGELTFGGMDASKFDKKTLVTVKNQSGLGFWETTLDAIHVNGIDMGWRNRTLILDTGTTLIIANAKDVVAIHAAIPGATKDGHTWTVPCTLKTPVSFTIGGQEFHFDPRDIAFMPMDKNNPSGACMSGIAEGNPGLVDTQWLIGDVFLKNVYFSTNVATNEVSLAIPS